MSKIALLLVTSRPYKLYCNYYLDNFIIFFTELYLNYFLSLKDYNYYIESNIAMCHYIV